MTNISAIFILVFISSTVFASSPTPNFDDLKSAFENASPLSLNQVNVPTILSCTEYKLNSDNKVEVNSYDNYVAFEFKRPVVQPSSMEVCGGGQCFCTHRLEF